MAVKKPVENPTTTPKNGRVRRAGKLTLREELAGLHVNPLRHTTTEEAFGYVKYDGRPVSMEEMTSASTFQKRS